MLGVMIDCSRNAVMSVKAVKAFVDILEKMGYDTLMLYTEDTYEVDNEPYFGYLRGRYTKAELKELDDYCLAHGMELIPCIQTLAHVNGIFHSSDVYREIQDCDDILLIGSERTYALLDHIFATLEQCFTSRKVHIGMDEAEKVGLGKYLRQRGFQDRFETINAHLHKVCGIAEKYGFQCMLWSDMFCRLAGNTGSYYEDGGMDAIRQKANLPKNVAMVYWDYYSEDYDHYVRMIKTNQAFQRTVVFAGGSWTWKGFAPDNAFSIRTTAAALKACADTGVTDVFMTLWGDDGGECSRLGILPALLYTAEAARGNENLDVIGAKFRDLTGMDMKDFLLLDQVNIAGERYAYNSAKYLLYNDPFMGLSDWRVAGGDNGYYKALGKKLRAVKPTESYRLIFETAAALCEVLGEKAELGVKTRQAYQKKDPEALRLLGEKAYPEVRRNLERFYDAFAAQWMAENKPHGFDIQDIRIGGLNWRLKQTQQRLLAYAAGALESIPELEEELLPDTGEHRWQGMATPNVVSHPIFR